VRKEANIVTPQQVLWAPILGQAQKGELIGKFSSRNNIAYEYEWLVKYNDCFPNGDQCQSRHG